MTRMVFRTRLAALAVLATAFVATNTTSNAADLRTQEMPASAAAPEQFHLRMHHLHTGEDIDVVYRIGDNYVPAALDRLNYFLRDHRTQDVSSYDPKEFDVLHALLASLHRPNAVIDIVCGYRTPWSNPVHSRPHLRSSV